MKKLLTRCLGALACAVVGWVAWAFIAAPIVPAVWEAPPNPGLVGVFASNTRLEIVGTVSMPDLGPEDIACSGDGWFYSGLEDGRIVRFNK